MSRLHIRMGSRKALGSLRLKDSEGRGPRLEDIIKDDGVEGWLPSGWKRLAVLTGRGDEAHFFEIEPAPEQHELRGGDYFIRGDFRVIRALASPGVKARVYAAWKAYPEREVRPHKPLEDLANSESEVKEEAEARRLVEEIKNPETLRCLFEALQAFAELGLDLEGRGIDASELKVWGREPWDTSKIFSYDADQLLLQGSEEWELVDRKKWEGEQLRGSRKGMGLIQSELAQLLGASVRSIKGWEKGAQPIPPMLWLALRTLKRESTLSL